MILVNILQRMYNDNVRQINSLTNSINSIRQTNNQIRNQLFQILNPTFHRRNHRNRNSTREVNREIVFDSIPYAIDINSANPENEEDNYTRFMQNFLRPIEIFPTNAQIEVATRNVIYSNILNPINVSCPISLENFNDDDVVSVIRFCGHIFNPDQLKIWFRTNCRCPVCRYDIRNYNVNTSILENNNIIPQTSDISNNRLFQITDVSNNRLFQVNDPSNNTTTNNESLITTYLDIFLENGVEPLINETNTILSIFNALQRRR